MFLQNCSYKKYSVPGKFQRYLNWENGGDRYTFKYAYTLETNKIIWKLWNFRKPLYLKNLRKQSVKHAKYKPNMETEFKFEFNSSFCETYLIEAIKAPQNSNKKPLWGNSSVLDDFLLLGQVRNTTMRNTLTHVLG